MIGLQAGAVKISTAKQPGNGRNNGVKHKRVAAQEIFDKFDAENSIIYSIDYVIIGTTNLAM